MKAPKLRSILQEHWPECVVPWLTDTVYTIPSLSDLKKAVSELVKPDGKFQPERNDCDDYALHLHSAVKKWVRDNTEGFQWPFLEVFVIDRHHNMNACYTDSGLYMVEPQTGDIWPHTDEKIVMYKG